MEIEKPKKPKTNTLKALRNWHKKASPVLKKIDQELEKDAKRKEFVNILKSGF